MDNKFFEILLPEYLIIKRKIRVLSLTIYHCSIFFYTFPEGIEDRSNLG